MPFAQPVQRATGRIPCAGRIGRGPATLRGFGCAALPLAARRRRPPVALKGIGRPRRMQIARPAPLPSIR